MNPTRLSSQTKEVWSEYQRTRKREGGTRTRPSIVCRDETEREGRRGIRDRTNKGRKITSGRKETKKRGEKKGRKQEIETKEKKKARPRCASGGDKQE